MNEQSELPFLSEEPRKRHQSFSNSTSVKEVDYDSITNTLEVEFITGKRYAYVGVPSDVVDELFKAASVGKYLNAFIIKAGYKCNPIIPTPGTGSNSSL